MSKVPSGHKRPSKLQKPKVKTNALSIENRHSGNSSTASSASSSYSESLQKDDNVRSKISKLQQPKSSDIKFVQSPNILDFRKKLSESNKKSENAGNKGINSLLNDIRLTFNRTKKLGPYSLLHELQAHKVNENLTNSFEHKPSVVMSSNLSSSVDEIIASPVSTSLPNKPQVLAFDAKSLKEYEYCCSNSSECSTSKNVHDQLTARSELKLSFKNNTKHVPLNYLSPTTDSNCSRTLDDSLEDNSLGILTPDQMEDFLDNPFSPTVDCLLDVHKCDMYYETVNISPSTENTDTPSPNSTMFANTKESKNESTETRNDTVTDHVKVPCNIQNVQDLSKNPEMFCCQEEDLLNSFHSSFLEPASSIVDININLDLPLDVKNSEQSNAILIKRIESTPSPEELPLDPIEISMESVCCTTYDNACSNLETSQVQPESKTDQPKSMESSKVSSSFITSITSMTSLDGYQGDGEMSRPASRGADNSPLLGLREEIEWQNIPVNRRPNDVMTDSDFFTESDADGHEDHHQKGDRKAQVIDGALYGKNGNPEIIVNNRNEDSCMESSGVYTDTEAQRLSPVFVNALEENNSLPEGSSPSSNSICSQNNESTINKTLTTKETLDDTTVKSSENLRKPPIKLADKSFDSNSKGAKQEKRFTLKKYKMPKRDVPSKLKSILSAKNESNSCDNLNKSLRKTDRRVVSHKNITNQQSSELKIKSYKDIKSKVGSFALQRSQTACSVTRASPEKVISASLRHTTRQQEKLLNSSVVASGKSSVHSSQSDISATSTPILKHERFNINRTTKKRDVASPLTLPRPVAPQTPAQTKATPVKKNGTLPKLSSSPVVRSRAITIVTSPTVPVVTNNNNNSPSPRAKIAARRATAIPNNSNTLQVKDPARMTNAAVPQTKSQPKALALIPKPRSVVPQPLPALVHAAKGVEALGVLVQYLVFQLEALNAPALRAEATRWRDTAATQRDLAARAARNHAQRSQRDLETISECLNKINSLERELAAKEEENTQLLASNYSAEGKYNDTLAEVTKLSQEIKELKTVINTLKREVSESRSKLISEAETKRILLEELEAVKAELLAVRDCPEKDVDVADKDKEELVAEVRSLRAVLELKQAEAGALRIARAELQTEVEKRDALEKELEVAKHAAEELKERATARQAEAEKLREQNQRLKDAAARDAALKTRLDMCNEELRYKLRQKSRVMNLLAVRGNSFHERSYSPPRRSRTSSYGSDSAEGSPSPSEGPDSPAAHRKEPYVKAVVEKHDSVSWVVEIEETPEETASRLAKKSNSFKKRRTSSGCSPPNSPRTAPHAAEMDFPAPLKESAGEAIYIYDNRQF